MENADLVDLIINPLLQRGYTIKASVLDLNGFRSTDYIVNGCDGSFHKEFPCYFDSKDPKVFTIMPHLLTTEGVDDTWFSEPEACKELRYIHYLLWYVLAKTLAKESAWKVVNDHGVDMVTIYPAMVIGPLLHSTHNTSAAVILNLINGAKAYDNATYGFVDVRDMLAMHIFLQLRI
ncbi:hypothetical protein AQUCO_00900230v1 [Aquilegia coerulea]|uniref:NAD-dependent epimerase/dehydratase domain-containing protein n=1 Tax=Aquilegia coerulea TaxID=218851 RepID=A0A2G5ECJ6_AQUCA|nr:hypothetical protein AQUCO_00900230v1 [Aquilegia coerulea]